MCESPRNWISSQKTAWHLHTDISRGCDCADYKPQFRFYLYQSTCHSDRNVWWASTTIWWKIKTFSTCLNSWQHKRAAWNASFFGVAEMALVLRHATLIFFVVFACAGVATVLLSFSWHYLRCTYAICHFVSFYRRMRRFLVLFAITFDIWDSK